MSTYAFATIAAEHGDQATLVKDGRHFRLDRLLGFPPGGLRQRLDDWPGLLDRVEAALANLDAQAEATAALVSNPHLLAPVRFPNKLICFGAVYRDHLEQMGLPAERWPKVPIFLRPPTTSIVGPGRTVRIPPNTRQFDWEIELAVIMGAHLTRASEAEAKAAIAGYAIGIDFSCRDLLDRGSPAGVDLVRSKAQDGMAPLGPVVVPARHVPDPQALPMRLWVNGELRQDGGTGDMLYRIEELVATVSAFITLEPGDVLMTGSPAGSARSPDEFLNPGDRIRAEIGGLGRLDLEIMTPTGGGDQGREATPSP